MNHGRRSSYTAGCRCPDCRESNTAYHRRHRPEPVDPWCPDGPPPPGAWVDRGACRGLPGHWFFPHRGEQAGPAKAVCAACPVRAECLAWALDTGQKLGIWGGTSERERRQLRNAS